MPALSYRAAMADDLPFLVHLMAIDDVTSTSADWADADADIYREALAAIDRDPHQELFVAELAGERVGTFQLTYIPGIMRQGMWRCIVESVHIIPTHRSQGLGGQMMRWTADRARERGCGMLQLTSNKARIDAHRFYRNLGFAQSHEGFKLML